MRILFGPSLCPVCDEHVYFAEELRAGGKSFHKQCFKCFTCRRPLDSFTVNEHDGKLFCKKCLSAINGPRLYRPSSYVCYTGHNINGDRRSRSQPRMTPTYTTTANTQPKYRTLEQMDNGYYSSSSRISPAVRESNTFWTDASKGAQYRPSRPRWVNSVVGGAQCANCADVVFANERVDAVGKAFHRLCFKCASCHRLLDRGSVCDHDREIFCQKCYTKHFGSIGFKAGTHLRCE